MRVMLKSKIHRARVTGANIDYEGSITIDETLMDAVGLLPYERVQVLNITNGARAETYAIPGPRDQGDIIMNGAIARMAQIGDMVIILSYGFVEDAEARSFKPRIIILDEKNRISKKN